jgi:hypothetical protein
LENTAATPFVQLVAYVHVLCQQDFYYALSCTNPKYRSYGIRVETIPTTYPQPRRGGIIFFLCRPYGAFCVSMLVSTILSPLRGLKYSTL